MALSSSIEAAVSPSGTGPGHVENRELRCQRLQMQAWSQARSVLDVTHHSGLEPSPWRPTKTSSAEVGATALPELQRFFMGEDKVHQALHRIASRLGRVGNPVRRRRRNGPERTRLSPRHRRC